MKRNPKTNRFLQERLTGLPVEVMAARKHMAATRQTCSRASRAIGVSTVMVKMVLSGRKTSARVLAGIMALPRLMTSEELTMAVLNNSLKGGGR
jgi:hypothetical protein